MNKNVVAARYYGGSAAILTFARFVFFFFSLFLALVVRATAIVHVDRATQFHSTRQRPSTPTFMQMSKIGKKLLMETVALCASRCFRIPCARTSAPTGRTHISRSDVMVRRAAVIAAIATQPTTIWRFASNLSRRREKEK